MTRTSALIAALALSACTTQALEEYRPVTDPAARTAARYDADLDLSQPAPQPRPEGLCEIHPICKGEKE